jgi:hypothetical protein
MDTSHPPAVRRAEVTHALAILDRGAMLCAAIAARIQGAAVATDLCETRLASDMFSFAEQAIVLADGLTGALAAASGRDDHPKAGLVFNRGFGMDLGPAPQTPEAVAMLLEVGRRDAARLADAAMAGGPATVRVSRPGDTRLFEAGDFFSRYVLPNGEFHLAMIYAIARSRGIAVGKADFEGPRPWRRPPE